MRLVGKDLAVGRNYGSQNEENLCRDSYCNWRRNIRDPYYNELRDIRICHYSPPANYQNSNQASPSFIIMGSPNIKAGTGSLLLDDHCPG